MTYRPLGHEWNICPLHSEQEDFIERTVTTRFSLAIQRSTGLEFPESLVIRKEYIDIYEEIKARGDKCSQPPRWDYNGHIVTGVSVRLLLLLRCLSCLTHSSPRRQINIPCIHSPPTAGSREASRSPKPNTYLLAISRRWTSRLSGHQPISDFGARRTGK